MEMILENKDLVMQLDLKPFVSVYMITYNHGAFIRQAIESVLCQKTNFAFQLVIGDDHSTDDTPQICSAYAQQFPDRIAFIRQSSNIGANANAQIILNTCFQSGAKYIAILEGDDFWDDPSKLQKQVDYLESHPEISVTWHDYDAVDLQGQPVASGAEKGYLRDYSSYELRRITSLKTLTVCFRNRLNQTPPEYSQCPNGDSFLFAMLGQFGGAAFLTDIRPAKYRIHTGGVWSEASIRKRDTTTLKSFVAIAKYFIKQKDKDTALYYIDRYIKTQYLLCYEDRKNNNMFSALKYASSALSTLIQFRAFKFIPYTSHQFILILFFGKKVIWSHRNESKN